MNWSVILSILYAIVVVLTCAQIIWENKRPARSISFLLLVAFLPFVGIIIYYLFGKTYRKKHEYSTKHIKDEKQKDQLLQLLEEYNAADQTYPEEISRFKGVSAMVKHDIRSAITTNNKVKLLINGETKFPSLLHDLEKAEHHIHIQYFTFADDEMGTEIADLLINKAKAGVNVRLIYDFLGSSGLRKKMIKKLKDAGLSVEAFHNLSFQTFINRMNFRNHRKIVVVDGKLAYVGGINVSNAYINEDRYPSKYFWRDTHMKIEGQAVWSLQYTFLSDWNFASENDDILPDKEYFPTIPTIGETPVQIVSSGPDSPYRSIMFAYLEAVHASEKSIYISTPYFVPGPEFNQALIRAKLRGVDVKILTPKHSDSWYVNYASKSNYQDLLDAGIEVYLYEKGMMHAKTIVCDNEFSMVGTANLDYRSFDLNFEVNAMIFEKEFSECLADAFFDDVKDSIPLDAESWRNRSKTRIFAEKLIALFSPML